MTLATPAEGPGEGRTPASRICECGNTFRAGDAIDGGCPDCAALTQKAARIPGQPKWYQPKTQTNACPDCGMAKTKHSDRCQSCALKLQRATNLWIKRTA